MHPCFPVNSNNHQQLYLTRKAQTLLTEPAGELFYKSYLLADFCDLFVFAPIIFHFLFFKIVAALGVNGNDQWAELFDAAVPEGLRHAQVAPFGFDDFFHFHRSYYRIAGREHTMDCAKLFTGFGGVFFHAALAYNDTYTCNFYKFILKLFHTHGRGGTYRNHLKLVVRQRPDDGACMENCIVANVHGNLASFFHHAPVRHVSAGGQAACQVNDIADLNVF